MKRILCSVLTIFLSFVLCGDVKAASPEYQIIVLEAKYESHEALFGLN